MKLVFSSVFGSDLAELVSYFNEVGGAGLSRRLEDEVLQLVEQLLKHPEMGRARKDLNPAGLRSLGVPHFRNYLLFYQVRGKELVLLRLRFGGMDLPALFPGG